MKSRLRDPIQHSFVAWVCVLFSLSLLFACTSTSNNETNELVEPNPEEAYVIQSLQLLQTDRLDEALVSITKALQINPDSADAYTVAGLIYTKNSQADLAERYFKRALSIEPNHASAQTNYASFLCKNDKPLEAEKIFINAAHNKNNLQPELAYTNAGLCVLGIPDVVKASNYFAKALKINPNTIVAWYQLAKIHYGTYDYEKAMRFLQEYEKLAQPTPKTLLLGAQIAQASGNEKLSTQYKLMLAQRFPDSKEAKQFTGKIRTEPAVYDARKKLDKNQNY